MGRDVLPISAKPHHYDLIIESNLEDFTFKGQVDIKIKFQTSTNKIWINSCGLDIESVSIQTEDSDHSVPGTFFHDAKKEQTLLEFGVKFKVAQSSTLCIRYSGIIGDLLSGYYRSSYKLNNGFRYMAITQFEPTDARKAFPCWDEPNMKATFSIVMIAQNSLTCLSNMNLISNVEEKDRPGMNRFTFATSPVMSTYLVAFAVGKLDYLESFTKRQLPVRIYTPKDSIAQAKFASEVSVNILDYFEDYFGIPYPLPKMDFLAVSDFSFAAMENWGLVTFQNLYLLFDEKSSSLKTKQTIVSVVAHELAHQWFGNLVTMDWWQDLWLNEGFATFIGWKVTDHLYPAWNVWADFLHDEQFAALYLDSLTSSHPIEVSVYSPAEINEIFDNISYSKGASVIKMLEFYLGQDQFQEGLKLYLSSFAYQNAQTKDLWDCLGKVSGISVSELMHTWTSKIGYPVLKVSNVTIGKEKCRCTVTQTRFLLNTLTQEDSSSRSYLWKVPLFIKWTTDNTLIIDEQHGLYDFFVMTELIKLNDNQKGFYRVSYPDETWQLLFENTDCLTLTDILGILGDLNAFALSGEKKTELVLSFICHLRQKQEYILWKVIVSILDELYSMIWQCSEEIKDQFHSFIQHLCGPLKLNLGWSVKESDQELDDLLRSLIFSMCGMFGDKQVIDVAFQKFEAFLGGDELAISPNQQAFVFSLVVKYGLKQHYDAVYKIFLSSKAPDQKSYALSALCYASNMDLIDETIRLILNTDEVKLHDALCIFENLSKNHLGRRLLWEFFRENYGLLYKKFSGSLNLFNNIVGFSISKFSSAKDLSEIESFFKLKEKTGYMRTYDQSIEKIGIIMHWLSREQDSLTSLFSF